MRARSWRKSAAVAASLVAILIGEAAAQPAGPQQVAPGAVQVSPAEAKLRRDWSEDMAKKAAPRDGCFTAAYPSTDWQETRCVTPPNIPLVPRNGPRPFVIGNSNDISARAPSGTISQAIGRFESVTNVTSISGPIGNAGAVNNAYTLQVNTNPMTSPACSGSPNAGCRGWEQFVYYNDGAAGLTFIQYWLLFYNATCPAGWTQFSFNNSTVIYCYRNAPNATAVPNQPIANMSNWTLTGTVSATADSVTMSTGANVYTVNGGNYVSASAGWTIAEFNIFGAGGSSAGGGMASFNAGASVNARTRIVYGGTAAPICHAAGFTGETNNLNFGPTASSASAPGPAVIFQESIAGGAATNCAAAVTVGDTHLRTFDGLFYDFQASGDFTVAVVDPGFEVQARQVSSAPTWPNASVNHAVAARFGKIQVAICLAPPGRDERAALFVDGKPAQVTDGAPLHLDGVGVLREGNVYNVMGDEGDSIRVTVNPTWLDMSVGLGSWPSRVRGLIANANGNIDQIATRDGHVLTNPFNFDELYGRFADSWRVSPKDSMLSVCSGGKPPEVGRPSRPFFAADLEPALREKARAVCLTAGVKQGVLLDACTLDVAVLGDPVAANVFVDMVMPGAVGRITGPGGGTPGGGGGGILKNCRWLPLALILAILIIAILIIAWLLLRKK